jgi:hypothetical protein
MKRKLLFLFVITFVSVINTFAQSKKRDAGFRSPLDFPLYLSGSFGELRSGHFHSGIDIKTGGVTGKRVHAIADGYVSRIKISLGGYGKALYITHPNGYMSVYGHLSKFNDTIQSYVKTTQYDRESYTVEIFPPKNLFKIKKGDVIAYTGNSGSSGGPHLHFEIRDAKTQYPLNPLLFKNIKVADHRHPLIISLALYPVDDTSLINGKNDTLILPVLGSGKNCFLKNNSIISTHGNISFGIRTYDLTDKINNKNGIYKIDLFIDTAKVFELVMDKISFYTTRYINSLIDYRYYQKRGKRIIRIQKDTNNRLFNYKTVINSGIFKFDDDRKHRITFLVSDIENNPAKLTFYVKGNLKPTDFKTAKEEKRDSNAVFVKFDKPLKIKGERFSADFPANSFYRSFYLTYNETGSNDSSLSRIIDLGSRFVPVHKRFGLSIIPDTVPPHIKEKMYIAKIEKDDIFYAGGDWKKNALYTRIREFGKYAVFADTVPPVIKALNFRSGKTVSSQKSLKLVIKDSETGIKKYRATVNGNWLLMEYDKKNDLLTYFTDEHLKKGKNNFKLVVYDNSGNKSEYEAVIIR